MTQFESVCLWFPQLVKQLFLAKSLSSCYCFYNYYYYSLIRSAQEEVRAERAKNLEERAVRLKEVATQKTRRALDLATEKGSSLWLTSLPLNEMGFNLNVTEFRDGLSLRYDWPIADIPFTCLCGEPFTIDYNYNL